MEVGTAWLFNLEAEDELAAARRGAEPLPPDPPGHAIEAATRALAAQWIGPRDTVIPAQGPGPSATDRRCRAWMPTPRALARLDELGLDAPPAPSLEALVRANARETFRGLDALPRAATAYDFDALARALRQPVVARSPDAPHPPGWVVRPSLTNAGRARLLVDAFAEEGATAALERARRYAVKYFPSGPLDVAPIVDIEEEYALHAHLRPDGGLRVGSLVRTHAAGGAWRAAERATQLPPEAEGIQDALAAVAVELRRLDYFGPFGIDAIVWVDGRGRRRLHAPLEVNARYTMSFRESGLPLA